MVSREAVRSGCVAGLGCGCEAAKVVVVIEDSWKAVFAPKKKRGRPAGRKDSVAGIPPKKKIGRPLGSKNKPKVQP
jgi:hypothetical protein